MPSLQVFARDDQAGSLSTSSSLGPTYIAGIAVAAAIVFGLCIWLGIRQYRSRAQAKREKARDAAFTPVRGVYRIDTEKELLPENIQAINGTTTFSREQLTRSVILPEKVITRPERGATQLNDDILDFHRQSGTFPKPFTFALTAGTAQPTAPASGSPRSSWIRYSGASSISNRFSVISSSSSVDSTPTVGSPRKVRQLFNPVLPDELLLTGLGERLTVVQAFDDGWVVVGRSNSTFASTAKSMFKSSSGAPAESDVELGVVPAWCFLKPVKGLRAERPVRSTSLGITVQMDGPSFSSRDEVISWSNF
ncbi:hypothetical protein DFH07DRAFT_906520 [Mycena maculata]|uniref:Uncharacterized protein n=1 Tax=Mycena maculata TaxID=230809 RepID=A0AAD7HSE8_9AGAR|nr:hypothetical protein DFH07DRAFT_906520 [Mycena maculata]